MAGVMGCWEPQHSPEERGVSHDPQLVSSSVAGGYRGLGDLTLPHPQT